MLIGARLGSPLVVGYGDGETYLGSDALALAPLTQKIAYLDEGDWVIIGREGAQIFDADNRSEEHTSELQSLMRISYAVFCLKKKKIQKKYVKSIHNNNTKLRYI